MKKLIIVTVSALLLGGGVVYAAPKYAPWTNNIYSVSDSEENYSPGASGGKRNVDTVSVFDDAGNKCYVLTRANDDQAISISCVKGGE